MSKQIVKKKEAAADNTQDSIARTVSYLLGLSDKETQAGRPQEAIEYIRLANYLLNIYTGYFPQVKNDY